MQSNLLYGAPDKTILETVGKLIDDIFVYKKAVTGVTRREV